MAGDVAWGLLTIMEEILALVVIVICAVGFVWLNARG